LLIASHLPKGQIPNVDIQEIRGLEESKERAQEVLKWFNLKGNITAQIQEFGNPSRFPNYENSKLKRREKKSRSAHDFGDTNTRSLRVTLSEVTCLTRFDP
jgi:hypothetical protein